ncbi:hypothetical protein [Cupriavidus metallidurans]|uniref:Uncharacterized protein n=1 Tax=Cupriavidus metallidurans (strain ATCC 43123 / DSM 2839 / NBRC 102507 / CH34) TaxID=266264 RepID=Q1LEU7_CUPMC|nr:hypothetical protein [Cupriavidus metallidurans]ABF11329.1 conserved hypothetical protein [Cupriavidus metallidurans CH34]QGS33248.1 hypothetical protein FOB83_31350 [Cupriavidus metallidurans]
MKRPFSGLLLCLASLALPVQGAAAADMAACELTEAIGLSMPERHAAIKIEAEAEIGPLNGLNGMQAQCEIGQMGPARGLEDDLPVWQDARPAVDAPNHPGKQPGAAASNAMLLQELPPAAMQYQRHAQPLAITAFTSLPNLGGFKSKCNKNSMH